MGGLIWWGLALIVIGLLLGLFGIGGGGVLTYIGWILLAVGVVLAIIHVAAGRSHAHH